MPHGQQREAPSSPVAASPSPSAYANEQLQRAASNVTIAVIGAGFLGRCIALDLSLLGVNVLVCDTNPDTSEALSSFAFELMNPMLHLGYVTKSMITRACSHIRVVRDVSECASAKLIVEAIPDNLDAKVNLFASLEKICSASTILATSTIELAVDAIQQRLRHRERFLGVRFFHPCVLLPPVEVTPGSETDENTVRTVVALLQDLQKVPHRGPTRRVLSNKEVSAFQFNTAVNGRFYHGLLPPQPHVMEGVVVPADGPPLAGDEHGQQGYTTSL